MCFIFSRKVGLFSQNDALFLFYFLINLTMTTVFAYVSLRLRMQNAVPTQPCVGKLGISLVLLNFLHCNFRLWFKTP